MAVSTCTCRYLLVKPDEPGRHAMVSVTVAIGSDRHSEASRKAACDMVEDLSAPFVTEGFCLEKREEVCEWVS